MKKESLTLENFVLYVGIDILKRQWSVSILVRFITEHLVNSQTQKFCMPFWKFIFQEPRNTVPIRLPVSDFGSLENCYRSATQV